MKSSQQPQGPEKKGQNVENSRSTIGLRSDPKVFVFACFIFVLSFLLRTIFPDRVPHIGDQGRDYLVALESLQSHTIPLQGIPSSIPRFSQGPANIWFVMTSFVFGGVSPFSPPLFSAFLTSIGFVSLFLLLCTVIQSRITSMSIVLFLASSSILVQQSRMPFYLFAIPLFSVIYFWLLSRVNSLLSLFFATIGFGLLFQWELATAPLIVCLVLGWKQVSAPWKQKLGMVGFGLLLGLAPQIVWDLGHQCAHLCTLAIWAGYRSGSFFLPGSEHAIFQSGALSTIVYGFAKQWQELFGVLSVVFLAGVALSLFRWRQLHHIVLYRISVLSFVLLSLGIIFHGHPSEAYFPPFSVIVSILLGYSLLRLPRRLRKLLVLVLICGSVWQMASQISQRFGAPSLRDSLEARDWIIRTSSSRPIQLMSYDPDARFESYLSFLRFLLRLKGVSDEPQGIRYSITFNQQSELPILNAVVAQFGHIRIARKSGEYY